jgi:signal transduction histidine kinase
MTLIESDTKIDRYRRLMDISRDLASTLDLDRLLTRIIQAAKVITRAEETSILLYDDAAKQLYFQVTTNQQPQMRGMVIPLEGSIAGWTVLNRRAVRISDVNQDERFFKNVAKSIGMKQNSLMAVPLITKEKIVGVLEAINKSSGDFTQDDEDLLSVLGAQAAVAIENTRLFQQSDLIAEFVHELRTPLASLSTATFLLLRPEISTEQSQQIIKNINSETQRLNTLATTFLDLARLESGRVQFTKTSFPLLPIFDECKSIMQNKADDNLVTIELDTPADLPNMDADRDKIKQVVLNFLSNAVKYNRPHGKVTLSARLTPSNWEIAIADTGIGIPEDALPHLFEKFFRVKGAEHKAGGTGLGLSICKGIVQGHGGRIEVKSRSGEGTTFTVFLPRK